jgi:hypothetical protein
MLASLPPEKQTSMRKAVNDMRADLESDRRVRDYLLLGEAIGVYDDVTRLYDDVTRLYDDVTRLYDDVTHSV